MIITEQTLDKLDFSKAGGLLVAIAQHHLSGEILMVAWMNPEALRQTLLQRQAVFFSRSRQSLWRKGESSGHVLHIKEIVADCDRDALLLRVMPTGPACHTGTRSCFLADSESDAAALARAVAPGFLHRLQDIIDQRLASVDRADPAAASSPSYTVRLAASGLRRIAQKVGEEGLETALAGAAGDREELCNEAADLLFHLLVLLRERKLSLDEVLDTLDRRHQSATPLTADPKNPQQP